MIDENQNNGDDAQNFQIFAEDHSASPDDLYFDEVVGALQEIMFDDQFEKIQDTFMRKYCSIFEETEQNKNQYMEVFNLYQKDIQQFVQNSLKKKLPNFEMPKFISLLENRTDQIEEPILDMIESFTEFQTFKRLMLEYKSYLSNEDNLKELSIKSNRIN